MDSFLATTGHYPKAWNAKKSDLISYELRNTRYDVEAEYARLIGEGYTIYDICAEGGLTYLSSKATGKYLCLYKSLSPAYLDTPETGTAQAGAAASITLAAGASAVDDYYNGMVIELTGGTGSGQYNIITDYVGSTRVATVKAWVTTPNNTTTYKIGGYDYIATADVVPHTDIIIMGIKLSAYFVLSDFDIIMKIYLEGGTVSYADKLSFCFVKVYLSTLYIAGSSYPYYLSFYNTELHLEAGVSGSLSIVDPLKFERNSVYFDNPSVASQILGERRDTTIINCKFYIKYDGRVEATLGSSYSCYITNCEFYSNNIVMPTVSIEEEKTFPNNIYINNLKTYLPHKYSGNGVIYYKDIIVINATGPSVVLRPAHPDRQDFIPRDYTPPVLNTSASGGIMDNANYQNLDALISSSLELVSYAGNDYSFRFYELSFQGNNIVDEDFKTMFAREQSQLVIWRDDLDATFVTATGGARKINNLALYENDGTTAYNYRNNENFFLLAEDANGVECVFSWYQGLVYPTSFTDFWDDTVYTIKRCFQILEAPDKITWRNKINGYADSPIEGSGSFKDSTWYYTDDR